MAAEPLRPDAPPKGSRLQVKSFKVKAPGQSRSPAVMQKVTLLLPAPSPCFYTTAPQSMGPALLGALHLEEFIREKDHPQAMQLLVLI